MPLDPTTAGDLAAMLLLGLFGINFGVTGLIMGWK